MEQKALIFNSVCVACKKRTKTLLFFFDVYDQPRFADAELARACQSLRRLCFKMTIM